MSNFGLPEYDQHREWIRNARNRNMKWEEIDYAGRGNDEGLSEFLTQQSLLNFWKEVSCSEWKELVRLQKEAEEQTQVIDYLSGQAMIMGEGEDNDVTVPADPQSAWQRKIRAAPDESAHPGKSVSDPRSSYASPLLPGRPPSSRTSGRTGDPHSIQNEYPLISCLPQFSQYI